LPYDLERDRFSQFRNEIARQPDVKTAMEQAIQEIFGRYDTRVRENRFVVGGVIEHIVGAAIRACHVPVRHRGLTTIDVDLVFEDVQGGYSVKSIFRATATRLVNVLSGEAPTRDRWRAATLFLVGGGIVYADPDLQWWRVNMDRCIRPRTDALEVRRDCVEEFAQRNPQWAIACNFPAGRGGSVGRSIASADVAAQILRSYPVLFSHLPELIR